MINYLSSNIENYNPGLVDILLTLKSIYGKPFNPTMQPFNVLYSSTLRLHFYSEGCYTHTTQIFSWETCSNCTSQQQPNCSGFYKPCIALASKMTWDTPAVSTPDPSIIVFCADPSAAGHETGASQASCRVEGCLIGWKWHLGSMHPPPPPPPTAADWCTPPCSGWGGGLWGAGSPLWYMSGRTSSARFETDKQT